MAPVATFHSRTPSSPVVATFFPSGLNARCRTVPLWPFSVVTVSPVATSNSVTVWSPPLVARVLPTCDQDCGVLPWNRQGVKGSMIRAVGGVQPK